MDYTNYTGEMPPDVGDAMTDKLQTLRRQGSTTIAGFNINVGPDLALALDPLIQEVQTWITTSGAASARKYGIELGKLFSTRHAGKVGAAAEVLWRFGLPMADVVGGIKNAVHEGFTQMHELSQEASAVLAANPSVSTNVAGVMGLPFSAIAHERKLVSQEAKKQLSASLTGILKNLPGVIINIWHYKRQRLEFSGEEAVLSDSPPATQSGSLISNLMRFLAPKTIADIDKNLKYEKWAPVVGALGARVVSNHLENEIASQNSAWRNIKLLENIVSEHQPTSPADIEPYVRNIFQQHVYDGGKEVKLAGPHYAHIVEAVSEAIVQGGLNPEALVELLDNKHVLSVAGKQAKYGGALEVKKALGELIDKYSAPVAKEEWKKQKYTPEVALELFKTLSEEEKPLFVMLHKPGMLEAAGIPKDAVAKYREMGTQEAIIEPLTTAVEKMLQVGADTLRKQGAKEDQIAELEMFAQDFKKAMQYGGSAQQYVAQNLEDTKELVRNVVMTGKKPGQLWKEFVGPARTLMDQAMREPAEAMDRSG